MKSCRPELMIPHTKSAAPETRRLFSLHSFLYFPLPIVSSDLSVVFLQLTAGELAFSNIGILL